MPMTVERLMEILRRRLVIDHTITAKANLFRAAAAAWQVHTSGKYSDDIDEIHARAEARYLGTKVQQYTDEARARPLYRALIAERDAIQLQIESSR